MKNLKIFLFSLFIFYKQIISMETIKKYFFDTKRDKVIEVIKKNDISKFQELLNSEIDINFTFNLFFPKEIGISILQYAILSNKIDIIKFLLNFPGLNINYKDQENEATALHYACFSKNPEIVKLLLSSNDIDVNAMTKYQTTALHVACINNRIEICKILLNHPKIKLNYKTKDGFTPLLIACKKYPKSQIINILLSHDKIDTNIKNNSGKGFIDYL